MHSYVQLITTPTADTAGTAMLFDVGKKRYLFGNIHEGLQRACVERNSRIAKTSDIFITGKTEWKNVGGLFGIMLTLADANASAVRSEKENMAKKRKTEATPQLIAAKAEKKAKNDNERAKIFQEAGLDPQEWSSVPDKSAEAQITLPTLTIHGGKNLTHTIATGRRFIFRKGMPIEVHEHVQTQPHSSIGDGRDPDWKDESIQVWKLPIEPANRDRSPKSPRKRSFGEFTAGVIPPVQYEDASRKVSRGRQDSEAQNDEQRRFVVTEMFNSEWRMDALTETPLVQVPMGTAMWIRNEETKIVERYYRPNDGIIPQVNVLIRRPWPGALVEQLPPTQPSQTAMSYIVRHYPQRGKFIPEKAKALNVHHLIFQALQQGATVNSRDGVTITPDMVLEPSRPGGGFAMVDLPSTDYITDFLNRPEWKMPRIMDGLQAIFWNLGPNVASTSSLQSFFHEHQTIRHIVMAPDISANNISFNSSTVLMIRLNQIDPQRYFIPRYNNDLKLDPLTKNLIDADYPRPHGASRGFHLQIEPSLQIQIAEKDTQFLNTAIALERTPADVLEFAQNAKSEIKSGSLVDKATGQDLPSQDAEVICLGTGSSAPSKYRNVSATLLRVPGCGSYLFDCGEGTLGQLRRLYAPSELKELFLDLKAIWISHLHADHHLGTASVIKAWYEANHGPDTAPANQNAFDTHPGNPIEALQQSKVLFLFSEYQMIRWLKEYSSVEDFGYERLIAIRTHKLRRDDPNCARMEWGDVQVGFCTDNTAMNEVMRKATGMTNLVTCRVDHCFEAQAISVTFPTGFKFSYSGDCRPSKEFVRIGQGSTVLVHEATFDDDMQGDAEAKKHSTMSEAIGVAQAMGAKRLILTHFSQRYQKIPNLGALDNINVKFDDVATASRGEEDVEVRNDLEVVGSAINFGHHSSPRRKSAAPSLQLMTNEPGDLKIAIAFDFLRVRVGDIAYLEHLTPILQRMFEISEEDGKAKAKDNPSEITRKRKEEERARKKDESEKQTQEKHGAKREEKWPINKRQSSDRPKSGDSVSKEDLESGSPRAAQESRRKATGVGAAPVETKEMSEREDAGEVMQVGMNGNVGEEELGQASSDEKSMLPLPSPELQQVGQASTNPP